MTKPKELKASRPDQIFEFDAKHIRDCAGGKRYAFVTVDTYSRRTHIRISSSISSRQAALAWEAATRRLGTPEVVVTDYSSKDLGEFFAKLAGSKTAHFFARVRQPKDKPFVERVIGCFETECLSLGGVAYPVAEQQPVADAWLAKYRFYRPHAALNCLTPHEFTVKMEAIKVSTML